MTSTSYLEFTISLIPVFFIAYAGYWAWSIRRALGVPIYRQQALGVVLVGVTLAWYIVAFSLYNWLGLQSASETALEVFSSWGVPPLVTFYWLDASIRAARRSDPLQREVLNWERLRRVFWAWVLAAFVVLVWSFVGPAIGVYAQSNGPPAAPVFIFILSPIFLVAIFGLVVLPRAARFAGDKRFGKHIKWFGLFFFFTFFPLVSIFVPIWSASVMPVLFQPLVFAVPQAVGGYCLYRSARGLAQLREPTIVIGAP